MVKGGPDTSLQNSENSAEILQNAQTERSSMSELNARSCHVLSDVRSNSRSFIRLLSGVRSFTGLVAFVGGPRVDAITGGLFRGNGLALCMVGWNPSAMALQSSRGHHKCTTRPSSTYILCPDVSRVLT
ncbi:hypothetical protein LR48_Vigan07g283700 [Vigna angularis]|uniref:Uncharacterized protein n=1 Tax=Phaseolus angularis TaxID=3914 RepID=A0A0L9V271_PHAAN|nr:hypothetical protein LR48_Vigan07g283700 [Vigna angularis]